MCVFRGEKIESEKCCAFELYQTDDSRCINVTDVTGKDKNVSTIAYGEDELCLIIQHKYNELLKEYDLTDERLKNTILKNKDVSRWIDKITKNDNNQSYA